MEKQKFFSLHNLQKPDVKYLLKLLKHAVIENNPKLLNYKSFTNFSFGSKIKVDENDCFEFLNNVFDYWFENAVKNYPTDIYVNKKYTYDSITKWFGGQVPKIYDYECAQYIFSDSNNLSPIEFRDDYFCIVYADNMSYDRMKKFEHYRFPKTRLYLNIDIKYLPQLAGLLTKSVLKKDIPLILKFSLQSNRNDSMVLYTFYEYINQVVDTINEIKEVYPQIFKNCTVANPLLATIDGYIGFGEDPIYLGSYSSIRAEILENAYKELTKIYNKDKSLLTNEKIIEVFAKHCKANKIDANNFHLNLQDCYCK